MSARRRATTPAASGASWWRRAEPRGSRAETTKGGTPAMRRSRREEMMQKIAARGCALALSTVMLAALALHGGAARAQSATMSPALKALAAAADKEGTVIFQGSTISWG